MLQEVTAETFDREVLQATLPVLVDYWAPWCAPCRMVSPIVEAIGQEYPDRLKVVKLNVDEHPEISQRYGVMSIPSLIVYRDGEVIQTIIGARPKQVLLKDLASLL
ncbi:MAG: thioredoxin [Candidatus Dormibacteria bacterium]